MLVRAPPRSKKRIPSQVILGSPTSFNQVYISFSVLFIYFFSWPRKLMCASKIQVQVLTFLFQRPNSPTQIQILGSWSLDLLCSILNVRKIFNSEYSEFCIRLKLETYLNNLHLGSMFEPAADLRIVHVAMWKNYKEAPFCRKVST